MSLGPLVLDRWGCQESKWWGPVSKKLEAWQQRQMARSMRTRKFPRSLLSFQPPISGSDPHASLMTMSRAFLVTTVCDSHFYSALSQWVFPTWSFSAAPGLSWLGSWGLDVSKKGLGCDFFSPAWCWGLKLHSGQASFLRLLGRAKPRGGYQESPGLSERNIWKKCTGIFVGAKEEEEKANKKVIVIALNL